ncbi:MAG TPA: sn-glycerol-3-phosphate ABC transporter ATP-binding protein UgpC [Burkholderiaceae bacterium]|nr:sn-glycerol-3-phosphate ABC transporter ATP-binding protein UgpC [Burkholderiaceae bacterium]
MAAVEMRKVTKAFGPVQIIRGVDLQIESGEFVVFVGPSGCGKSTLLRMIAGLEDITSGDLMMDGVRANALAPAKRHVGMVFQSYALYPHMTVYENMAFGLTLAKEDKDEVRTRVLHAAQILQLDQLLQRLPKELSGGQRQRVAIGRAIVRKPKVFLFDEPLSNLDAALRVQMRIEIAKLHDSMHATMVYVTHDQVEAMTLADKIVVLNKGNVEQVGAPLELYHYPRNLFVAGFIGSPKMNFIDARLVRAGADAAVISVPDCADIRVAVDATAAKPGDKVVLGIRPEHFQVSDTPGAGIGGLVTVMEQLGDETYAYVEAPGTKEGLLNARLDPQTLVRNGQSLRLTFAEQSAHLFNEAGIAFRRVGDALAQGAVKH